MIFRKMSLMLGLGCTALSSLGQTAQPIPLDAAKRNFTEALALCQADAGKLWGVSLCGPILLVDPESRTLVANQPDGDGRLKLEEGAFVGVLPKSESFANTATDWSGTHWTEVMWPLPDERSRRDTLMMHELFHRVQDRLIFAPMQNVMSTHLDTLDGRYTILLEYRALTRALNATDDGERRSAIADALLFRADRYRLFPSAAADEKALEMNEGLAEYTGVRLGNPEGAEAKLAALRDLQNQSKVPSLVRSFAYGTGPAYGLLLDRSQPDWRMSLGSGQTLPALLQAALKLTLPSDLEGATKSRAEQYDGTVLYAAESQRETERQARLRLYRARFVTGPTLTLPLKQFGVQFDPRTVQTLDDLGIVYPEIRISDVWGILEVSKGALVKGQWNSVVLPAPADSTTNPIRGDGWDLDLKPGWKLVPSGGKGDFLLQSTP